MISNRFFNDLFYLFKKKERRKLYMLLFGMIVSALFETIGVASIGPFMSVVLDDSIIQKNEYLFFVYSNFEFANKQQFLIWLGTFFIVVLLIANTVAAIVIWMSIRFSNLQGHYVSTQLLKNYLEKPFLFYLDRNSSDLSKNILSEVVRLVDGILMPVLVIKPH